MTTDLLDRVRGALSERFAIERQLADDGPLCVFEATEKPASRPVVLKVVPPALATRLDGARFIAEVERAAAVDHPRIGRVIAAGAADDLLFYAMPAPGGESLRARLGRTPALASGDAARILHDLAHALAQLQQHGVIHGGLTPDRVFLVDGHAIMSDAGVVPALRRAARPGPLGGDAGAALALDDEPATSAPELVAGAVADTRTDVYAIGAMGYWMLAGHPPFEGTADAVRAAQRTREAPPLPSATGTVAPEMAELVARCLARDPAERWPDGAAVRSALDAVAMLGRVPPVMQPSRRLTRQQAILIGGGLAILLLGVLVALLSGKGLIARMRGQ